MRKNRRSVKSKNPTISPEEAIQFLEDMRLMSMNVDEPTVAISLRVPGNVLRSIKVKAGSKG